VIEDFGPVLINAFFILWFILLSGLVYFILKYKKHGLFGKEKEC